MNSTIFTVAPQLRLVSECNENKKSKTDMTASVQGNKSWLNSVILTSCVFWFVMKTVVKFSAAQRQDSEEPVTLGAQKTRWSGVTTVTYRKQLFISDAGNRQQFVRNAVESARPLTRHSQSGNFYLKNTGRKEWWPVFVLRRPICH